MSIECSECERDLRGGHDETCSRYASHHVDCEMSDQWADEESQCTCPVGWPRYPNKHGAAEE